MLSVLSLAGLLAKLLVIGASIGPPAFPPSRAPVAATLAILAVFCIPIAFLRTRAQLRWALALNICGTMIALGDLWHVRFYGDLLSIADLDGVWQIGIVLGSLRTLIHPMDLLAFVDLLVIGALLAARGRTGFTDLQLWPNRRLVVAVLAIVATLGSVRTLYAVHGDPDEVFEYAYQREHVAGAVGLAGYHLYDLGVHLAFPFRGRLTLRNEDVRKVEALLETRRSTEFQSRLAGVARGQNVIMLSAESLQAFVLGLSVDGEPIAPNLTAFARESLDFTDFYDQTHMGTTADALFVSLNSMMPLPSSAVSTRYPANDFRALPHVLRERGYQTLSACAEPPSVWNMAHMHPKLGFTRNLFGPDFAWTETVGVGLDDTSFFEQLVPALRDESPPFFAYLISSSNHHPYTIPTHLRRLRPQSLPSGMAGDYLQSVRYFDEAFGKFVAGLKRDGVLDRTMIVLFGDHQSWLEDADLERLWRVAGHGGPASRFELWRFRRRVPLLIRLPHQRLAGPRDTPGGHLDITPTVLSLAGLDGMTGAWLGRDLTAAARRLVVFRDGNVTDGETTILKTENGADACFARDSSTLPCEWLQPLRDEAATLLEASDHMIEGNLASGLYARLQKRERGATAPGRVLAIAHRGASTDHPENTLDSIRAAFELGADAVEVDVRLSRDGVPVIFHDDTLDRTTDGRGLVENLTLRQLKALDAGSWMAARFAGARIPTLDEAVRAAKGRGDLLLDLKVDGLAARVREIYDRAGEPQESALIGGWTPGQRAEFVRDMPGARILKTDAAPVVWGADLFRQLRRDGLWGFEAGDYWPASFLGDAALHGVPVIAYTVNDEVTARRVIEAGVAGIETDDPALILRVAASLGAR